MSRCLQDRVAARPDVSLIAIGRPELDLAEPDTIARTIDSEQPDIVISAAAFTAVDAAEDDPDMAYCVNEEGAGAVAAAAAGVGAPIIHLSTDYVFSGDLGRPYTEDDVPDPQSVYGASKLAGEKAVATANPRHIILRTSWIYSPFGKNFKKTMLELARTRSEISVVEDQVGSPTSAFDIADVILDICQRLAGTGSVPFGVHHFAGKTAMSWADFAEQIMVESKAEGGPSAKIRRIASDAYPTRAKRPKDSRLVSVRNLF